MSIRNVITILVAGIVFCSCTDKVTNKNNFDNFSKIEKDSIAKRYHQSSNYFLQPSHLYRKYKDSALAVTPDNVVIRQKLSYSYKKRGEHIKAMEILNKAVEYGIAQNNTDALGYRAWTLLYYYRDYEGAIKDVDAIEAMTGTTYNICWGEPCGFQKGQALYKLGKYDEAIAAFEQVSTDERAKGFTAEDNMYLFFYKGRCYEEKKEYKEARKNYEIALKAHDKFPEAFYRLGKIQQQLNDTSGALKYYTMAKEYINYKMQEPYIERFDEMYIYMIDKSIETLKPDNELVIDTFPS